MDNGEKFKYQDLPHLRVVELFKDVPHYHQMAKEPLSYFCYQRYSYTSCAFLFTQCNSFTTAKRISPGWLNYFFPTIAFRSLSIRNKWNGSVGLGSNSHSVYHWRATSFFACTINARMPTISDTCKVRSSASLSRARPSPFP